MKLKLGVLAAVLMLCAMSVNAATLIYHSETMTIALHEKPCDAKEVLAFIQEDKHERYHAASAVWQGRPLKACWADVPKDLASEPTVFIVDEDGDAGTMTKAQFKPDDGSGPKVRHGETEV